MVLSSVSTALVTTLLIALVASSGVVMGLRTGASSAVLAEVESPVADGVDSAEYGEALGWSVAWLAVVFPVCSK